MAVALAPDTADLWRRFKERGDANARIALIEKYAWMARVGAERIHVPPTAMFSKEDIYGHAVISDRRHRKFDPAKGRPFEAYAPVRIRGAIADALRSTDWLPRGMRQAETRLREVMARIEMRERRPATDSEVCADMGISEQELDEIYQASNASAIQSLEEIIIEIEDLHSSTGAADNSHTNRAVGTELTVRQILVVPSASCPRTSGR